jgi:hypothetical protein
MKSYTNASSPPHIKLCVYIILYKHIIKANKYIREFVRVTYCTWLNSVYTNQFGLHKSGEQGGKGRWKGSSLDARREGWSDCWTTYLSLLTTIPIE